MIDSTCKWRHAEGIGWVRIRKEGDLKVVASEAFVPNGNQSSLGFCSFSKGIKLDEETGVWL